MEGQVKEEFEIEKIIPVNIIEDKKQMRISIPTEIIEKFGINPLEEQFAWVIQKSLDKGVITITGRFLKKQQGAKNDEEKSS